MYTIIQMYGLSMFFFLMTLFSKDGLNWSKLRILRDPEDWRNSCWKFSIILNSICPTIVWKLKLSIYFNAVYKPSFIHMARLTRKISGLGEQNHHKEKLDVYANIWRRDLSSD